MAKRLECTIEHAKSAEDIVRLLRKYNLQQLEEMPINLLIVGDDDDKLLSKSVAITTAHGDNSPCIQFMVAGSYNRLDLNGDVLISQAKLQELQRGYLKAVDYNLIIPNEVITEDE